MKSQILRMLREGKVLVEFTKADNTRRVMLCTLQEQYIQKPSFSTTSGPEHLVTVWDLEKEDWRSFRVDSIRSYNKIN